MTGLALRRAGAAALTALSVACGGSNEEREPRRSSPSSPPGSMAAAPTDSSEPPCPADGVWRPCSVVKRLEMAGLVLRDSTAEVVEPPLTMRGTSYQVGDATLVLFYYPDEGARLADQARLDTTRFVDAYQALTLRGEATRIASANLLAILRSRRDQQRERISDALTAGPPQGERGPP